MDKKRIKEIKNAEGEVVSYEYSDPAERFAVGGETKEEVIEKATQLEKAVK